MISPTEYSKNLIPAPIYSDYHNRAYLGSVGKKSSIRTGYVDLSGTQIRLIFPYFRYCLDCCKKSSADYSIPWEHDPGNFFFLSFAFFSRTGNKHTHRHSTCHLCHTYIASLLSPVTLARRRTTNTRMLPHGPSSFHSYTIVTSVRRRDETKCHKAMSS